MKRPKSVRVYFTNEVEIKFDRYPWWLRLWRRIRRRHRFMENVLPLEDASDGR